MLGECHLEQAGNLQVLRCDQPVQDKEDDEARRLQSSKEPFIVKMLIIAFPLVAELDSIAHIEAKIHQVHQDQRDKDLACQEAKPSAKNQPDGEA